MVEKYTMAQIRKMNIGELSSIIAYDYRDFMAMGEL